MNKRLPFSLIMFVIIAFQFGCRQGETVIANLEDAKHARIGVMTGTTGEAITNERYPEAQIKSFDDIMDAVVAIKSGQLDAIVTSYPTAVQISKKNKKLAVLPEPLTYENTAIAVRKDNDALLAALNKIISELRNDGTLESMQKRWLKLDLTPYEELDITPYTKGEPLKIGVSATREPFSFVDKNGRVTGHDGELARIIAEELKRPIEFYNMKFMALIPALQSGKVDLIVTGMTATEERSKFVNFTQSYFANAQVILVKKSAAKSLPPDNVGGYQTDIGRGNKSAGQDSKLVTIADLKDKQIAVLLGSAHDTYAIENFPDATILQYKTPADVALAVKAGKVDAALFDAEPLREIMRRDDSLALLGNSLFTFNVGAGFKKDNHVLKNRFNQFLARIKRSGVYEDMVRRWIEKGETRLPVIENPKNNGILEVGVSDVGMPFTAVQDNRLVGFDIELAERFAAFLGKEVNFANMDFSSLIAAVASGKVDIIVSSIYVTEERANQINFSEPYYEMGTRIFALKKNIASGAISAFGQTHAKKLASVADLEGKRIGVLMGSVHDTYATEHFPDAAILQYKSPSDLVLAVKSGKADAAIYNRENLYEVLRKENEFGILEESLLSVPVGIGFNKDNDFLREQFNSFLKEIKTNGDLDDMVKRWIIDGNTMMPAISNLENNGVLVVGIVSDKGLPFAVIQNNRLIGFDIELAERFGAYLGKAVKFSDMEFGNLIAAAAAGKIDMIDSTLMITEERKTRIDFSEPYYELGASVFALKSNLATYEAKQSPATISGGFFDRLGSSFHSNIIHENRYLLIWDGLKTTVVISVFSTILGTVLGALVCFMRMSKRTVLNLPARIYINILRGMPVLVLLMLIFYVVFASVDINPTLVAIIAFGMNFAAYVSEIFRSGIEGIDKGQTEAGIAMGFTKFKTFVFIILPQTIQRILPVYKGEFISLVKMTSIVGYIAVQDLTKASDIIRARTFDAFFPLIMVAILYFTITWVLIQSLEYLERVNDPRSKRRIESKA